VPYDGTVPRVQSIERAFSILSALADGPIGVTAVAERAGLPKSTASRLLTSLASLEVVEQIAGETRWRLGPRIVTLAAAVRPTRSLIALARPRLVELANFAGEAVGLSIPDGFTVHYIDQVDGSHPVGVRDWTGTRLPMHAVSRGAPWTR
jgi:DNA-binding IclR family transcriptional regulator